MLWLQVPLLKLRGFGVSKLCSLFAEFLCKLLYARSANLDSVETLDCFARLLERLVASTHPLNILKNRWAIAFSS